ncbi:hypothetical protein [Bacillus badius]|uniref:Uncharacterized protein n=1 Tax=Bacillus badius TaxID=1455 RepID=A0ABR5AY14_BACBA|nr:hypothetical protein [Bacillus badius]KIL79569.1 hypothetical protein SD77_2023 [Bacillus badius]MED4716264.1 hypothetical protein [Bacillus badius]
MIEGLLLAFILSLFEFDSLFIQGVKEWTGIELTSAGYYVFFFFGGAVFKLLEVIANRKDDIS